MIDVNKITSTLAKLPDAQLQQYAQMHKADPYIMALAMSESNRRKEMRSAGQGAQGMQEQPKVVDQMVAEMAPRPAQPMPEDQGIGQLPAGEMNFAGGGIIAFADGGDVERYSGEFGSFIGGSTMDGFMPSGAQQDIASQATDLATSERTRTAAAAKIAELRKRVNELQFTAPELIPSVNAQIAALVPSAAPKLAPSPTDPNFRRQPDPRAAGANTFADSVKAVSAAPTVDTVRKSPAAEKPAAGLAGLPDPAKVYQDILAKQDYTDPAAGGLLELEAQERANAAARRQSILADAERFKDAYKGREGRLAEREADIGKQKESNKGLAFLNAGLAIMSTPGGLASAIGKGAQVGTAQFAAGLDKIRSAQERLGEARDRLDDLKLNREETTAKEIRDAEDNYRRVAVDAKKRGIDGVRTAAGLARADAKNIYDKTMDFSKTVYEQDQANKRAAGQNRNQQLEVLRAVTADPQLAAAYRAMHGKGVDVMDQYNEFLKANPALAMDPKAAMTQFLTSKTVFSQLGGGTVTDKPSTNVRKQP